MWHGAGHREVAGDRGSCDRHVRSGAESPQDSVRLFTVPHIFAGCFSVQRKMGHCSVSISIVESDRF